ncbi:MAG: PAS domain S-box protein [Prolixibacteraceae bacterium]|nr:PAS domain S-box protein [Prolixibacteraceae bacterium]
MKKILAIDDQQDNLSTIKAVIKSNMPQCSVLTALSGSEGINIAREQQPDTILLDIIMPGMDGYEVCKRLKADDSTKHIPVVMVTAIKTDPESRVKGLKIGADAFLSKPIDPVEFSAQVNVMLRIKEAEDKLRTEKEDLEELVLERTTDLRESEEFVKRLIASSNDCIKVLDLDGNLLSISAGGQKLLEIEDASIYLNKPWADFWEGEDNVAAKEAISKAKNGGVGIFTGFSPTEKGKPKWWEIIITPINDSKGKLESLLAISRDISHRKQAEDIIRENEEKLSLMIENSPIGVSTTDLKGNFISVNPALCNIIGYSNKEMIGKHFNQFSHSDDATKNKNLFKKLVEGEISSFDLEKRYVHKNRNIVNVFIRAQLIRDKKGKPLFQTAIIEDITERRQAEESVKKQDAKIQSIFRSAPVGIGVVSNRIITQVNSRLCEITGYTADELIGQNSILLYPTQQEYENVGKNKYDQIKEKGTGTVETRLIRKDGRIIDVLLSSTPINQFDLNEGVTFTALDITKRKLAEKALSEKEIQYRTLFEQSPDAVVIIDPKTTLPIRFNQQAKLLLGYTDQEFSGLKIQDYEAIETPTEIKNNINNILKKGGASFETKFKTKTGILKDVFVTVKVTKLNGKQVLHNIYEDISKRIKTQKALLDSQTQLKLIIDKIPGLLAYINSDEKYLYVNKAYADFYEIPREKFIGNYVKDMLPAITYIKAKENFKQVLLGKETINENRFPRKDETISIVRAKNIPHFNEQGKVIAYLVTIEDITDWKLSEEKLKESEQKLRNIFENSTSLFYSHSTNHIITYLSPQVKTILGYTMEEAFIKWTELASDNPANEIGFKNTVKAIETGKRQMPYELELVKKSGEKIWVEVREFPQLENGKTKSIVGSLTEITERKRAGQIQKVLYNISQAAIVSKNIEELVKTIQKQLGIIIDTKNFYVAFYDEKLDTFTSPFVSDEKDDLKTWPAGKSLSALVVQKGKPLLIKKGDLLKMSTAGEADIVGSISEVWLGVPLISEGNTVGVFAVQSYTNENAFDLKDMKLLEFVARQISTSLERKKAEQTLKESEERFKKLSTLTFEGIVLHDEGKAVDINLSLAKMFGYEYEELIGKNVIEMLAVKEYHSIIAKNTLKSNSLPYEIEAIKKDGTRFPVEIEGRDVTIKAENKKLRVAAIRDITQRKKAEEELKAAYVKATESDRLKSAFLATISHELRTPLNAIIGFSEFLDKDLSMDEVEKFGQIIHSSGNHLLSIVNDLFDITLIEAGETKVRKEEITLKSVFYDVQSVIEAKKQKDGNEGVELKLILTNKDEGFTFLSDANKIKQILINLLKNAIKFTHEGYIHYGCELIKEQDNPFLKFYVKDTGIGITSDKQELIFDIFRQVEDSNSRRYGGTGIGLSVAKRLAELLGGKIWLESEVGKGSAFFFTIPVEKTNILNKPVSKLIETKASNKTKTILIAEDDESSFRFIEIVLDKLQFNFIWVKNGEEAIQLCKENQAIDLVLMDINMPVLNGYDATKKIKKFKPELPIIAQTAYAIAGDREKVLEAGCEDYITKPINRDVLIEMIGKYI